MCSLLTKARVRSISSGDAISVDLLLRHGASVATRDGAGLTPLHWAVVKGNKVSLRRLIEAGADLDAKDDAGKTSRDMARELKSEPAFERALEEAGRWADGRIKAGRFDEVRLFRCRASLCTLVRG
jgi:hypothetical protein